MAVDPQRLQSQLDQLVGLADRPERLQRATIELLEGYQVRKRSAGRTQYSVPSPVLRALARTLQAGLRDDADRLVEAASALWGTGRSEARSLAVQLLADQTDQRAAELVERWTHASVGAELMRQLTETGLRGWRQAAPEAFVQRCSSWLEAKQRLLGLYALRAAVRDPAFENLPRVYELVEGLGGSLRGRPRRALLELMRELARRTPAETIQFLRQERKAGGAAIERLIRDLLPSLSPEQRQALKAPNGIMRD